MIQELNVTSKIRINFKNLKRNVVLGTGYSSEGQQSLTSDVLHMKLYKLSTTDTLCPHLDPGRRLFWCGQSLAVTTVDRTS